MFRGLGCQCQLLCGLGWSTINHSAFPGSPPPALIMKTASCRQWCGTPSLRMRCWHKISPIAAGTAVPALLQPTPMHIVVMWQVVASATTRRPPPFQRIPRPNSWWGSWPPTPCNPHEQGSWSVVIRRNRLSSGAHVYIIAVYCVVDTRV